MAFTPTKTCGVKRTDWNRKKSSTLRLWHLLPRRPQGLLPLDRSLDLKSVQTFGGISGHSSFTISLFISWISLVTQMGGGGGIFKWQQILKLENAMTAFHRIKRDTTYQTWGWKCHGLGPVQLTILESIMKSAVVYLRVLQKNQSKCWSWSRTGPTADIINQGMESSGKPKAKSNVTTWNIQEKVSKMKVLHI